MSKVGGALPSWYWPPGVPRRVPVAQQPLDRLLRQRFTKVKDSPALVSSSRTISYGELLARVQEIAGGLQALKLAGSIAIGETDAIEGLTLLLGGLFAGRPVFLPDPSAASEVIGSQLAEAKASIVLTAGQVGKQFEGAGIPTVRKEQLQGTFSETGGAKRATDAAVLLPSGRGIVVHSHFSLSAMSASLAAFIIGLRELPFLCTEPNVGSWETLAAVTLALLHGMPIAFARLAELEAGAALAGAERGYVILERHDADGILRAGRTPRAISEAPYLFVSMGPFAPKWRRKFEKLVGRPISPLWGLPELGPVVAPHPTWMPIYGHGFPLVNVSLVPIDPGTGKVSIVPWELLEEAEVGVETLSVMAGYAESARNASARVGTALRTREIASMDHVGVVVLRGPAARGQEAASAN